MSARSEYLVSYAVIIIGVLLMAFFFLEVQRAGRHA